MFRRWGGRLLRLIRMILLNGVPFANGPNGSVFYDGESESVRSLCCRRFRAWLRRSVDRCQGQRSKKIWVPETVGLVLLASMISPSRNNLVSDNEGAGA